MVAWWSPRRGSALLLAASLICAAPAARAASVVPEPTPRPVIAEVVLELPPGEAHATVEPLVALRAGEQLNVRDARRTVQLIYQLGRYANVIVSTRSLPDGRVAVTVSCIPRRLVRALHVVNGASRPALSADAITKIAALQPGDELWPGRAERAAERVRAELERRGWRSARVSARAEGEPNAEVVLSIEQGTPVRVTSLAVEGTDDPARSTALAAARVRPGEVLDSERLIEDGRRMREALHAQGYLQARVGPPVVAIDGESARITVRVEPGPRVAVRFAGAANATDAELREAAGIDPDQPLDSAALEIAAARLRTWYRLRGHALAEVTVSERATPGLRTVIFAVEEGPRYRVDRIAFVGAEHQDPRRLEEQLLAELALRAPSADAAAVDAERAQRAVGSRAARRARRVPSPGEAWEPQAWEDAIARVVEQVKTTEGYLDAAHTGTRVAMDAAARTIQVEIGIREGTLTRVESVDVEGAAAVPRSRLDPLMRVRPGDPLSYAAIEQTRASFATQYASEGHLYARVDVSEEISTDRTAARLRFRIEEGPRVRISNVVLTGNRRTREDVVRDALSLRPGDVFAQEAVARSQAQLLRLGVFRSVGLRLSDPEIAEAHKDLTVEVAERPWRTVAPGFGFSIANGPRAFIELVQPNLFGRAIEGTARAKVNYPLVVFRPDLEGKAPMDRIEGRADVGVHDPRFKLLPVPAGARLDFVGERIHRRAYELTRGSALAAIDLAPASRLAVSLQYEFEIDDVLKSDAIDALTLTRADVERLRFPEGYTVLHAFRPVLALDFRDNSVQPRRGWLASTSVEWAHSIGYGADTSVLGLPGSDVYTNMLKLSGTVSGYVPLGPRTVLALSMRAGRVLPLDPDSQTIGPKRFYLGGASSMRGYAEDEMLPEDVREDYLEQVRACQGSPSGAACSAAAREIASGTIVSEGGEVYYLGKAELRFPLSTRLEAGLFTDVGNLWLNPRSGRLADVRYNVGVGLRVATPIGPAVVDLGFNVEPDERLGESLFAPHFSIGVF
jgi:outer membrane protein assembly complex protein YaeT